MIKTGFSAAALLLAAFSPALAQEHPAWTIVAEDSSIAWATKWKTTPVKGGFERFTADIRFDPAALEDSEATVTVDIESIFLKGEDARKTLTNDNWFDADDHPKAVFKTKRIRRAEDGGYEALAELTIRGIAHEVALPFSLDIVDGTAEMSGETTIDRTAFDIGGGSMNDDVAEYVTVSVSVTARRR